MSNFSTEVSGKKRVTRDEFDKKVDIAYAYLEYMDRLKPEEARARAYAEVSKEYVAV